MFPSPPAKKRKTSPNMKRISTCFLIALPLSVSAQTAMQPVRLFILAGHSSTKGHGFVLRRDA
jgi:hypothetical protein